MGMESVPVEERPRERMWSQGTEALSDAELVAMLLGSGVKGASAIEVARKVIDRYGDVPGLGRAVPTELAATHGIGKARACALAAALELGRRLATPKQRVSTIRYPGDVYALMASRLAHLRTEVFITLCLDAKHRVIREARIAEGGFTSVMVLPREAFAPAMREGSPAVVFVHNHPSGDPEPSDEDLALTARLKHAGLVLGVNVLDHVVIAEKGYVSMLDNGKLAQV